MQSVQNMRNLPLKVVVGILGQRNEDGTMLKVLENIPQIYQMATTNLSKLGENRILYLENVIIQKW